MGLRRTVQYEQKQSKKLLTPEILKQALLGAVKKLDPRYMIKNPVMFVVEVGFFITLLLTIVPGLFGETDSSLRTYNLIVSVILLVTVLFANFAESVAEGAGQGTGRQSEKRRRKTPWPIVWMNMGMRPSSPPAS